MIKMFDQVVGGIEAGVDKRLDVLATALRNKMTIDQMVHLELSYAPPFGNAKDVLNVAAFTAMNQHNGLVNAKYSVEDLDDKIQVRKFFFARIHQLEAVDFSSVLIHAYV
jgi:hypothetical protein